MMNNDLADFMKSATLEIENEYKRIQKRATEDPGTAGDQGEENWATLLRNWLPPIFQVVTKGRILSDKGIASPQVDVIILHPEYPKQLLDKKLYLAGGVFAAFECKTTLKAFHIDEFMSNSKEIKSLLTRQFGSPYKELQSHLLYGLLAHSHSWKSEDLINIDTIKNKLIESDEKYITHPFLTPDLLCVSNLATWSTFKVTFIGPSQFPDWSGNWSLNYGPSGSSTSAYISHHSAINSVEGFTPIGALLTKLLHKIAWQYPNLRMFARYFELASVKGAGSGYMRKWDSSIFSTHIRKRVENGELSNGEYWDEWSLTFY